MLLKNIAGGTASDSGPAKRGLLIDKRIKRGNNHATAALQERRPVRMVVPFARVISPSVLISPTTSHVQPSQKAVFH